nr:ParB/RepB/Spo0J family partition protein [Alkalibaculum sporogenes]
MGKGLNALIPEAADKNVDNNIEIDIQEIVPNKSQPRKEFNQEKLQELSDSIAQHGIIQPIIVSKIENGFQIIAGERRWRAAMKAGMKTIPVVIKEISDKEVMEIALIENLQREDLNDIEEAIAYKQLMDKHALTQNEISIRLGKSRVAIANTLRLLQLPEDIRRLVIEDKLTAGHARAILSIPEIFRERFAERIIKEKLSVRETEKKAVHIKNNGIDEVKINEKEIRNSDFVLELQEKVQNLLGTKVSIKHKNSKGKIEITYYSDDDLERIIRQLID